MNYIQKIATYESKRFKSFFATSEAKKQEVINDVKNAIGQATEVDKVQGLIAAYKKDIQYEITFYTYPGVQGYLGIEIRGGGIRKIIEEIIHDIYDKAHPNTKSQIIGIIKQAEQQFIQDLNLKYKMHSQVDQIISGGSEETEDGTNTYTVFNDFSIGEDTNYYTHLAAYKITEKNVCVNRAEQEEQQDRFFNWISSFGR